MKFETFTTEGMVSLPAEDMMALLSHHLRTALFIADSLDQKMVGIYIDQALCDLAEQRKTALHHNDDGPA